jgi:uncharacterized protein YciI
MFLIDLHYIQPLEEIEKHLPAHVAYLEKGYSAGNFICSGRKNPRTGGIILCKAPNKEAVMQLIADDPFYQHRLADYHLTEFLPTKYAAELEVLLK